MIELLQVIAVTIWAVIGDALLLVLQIVVAGLTVGCLSGAIILAVDHLRHGR